MKDETLILFTGDSITDGNRYKKKEQEWDLNHQIGHSYAYIINGLLGSLYPQKRFRFKNRGVSGNRVIDLYARIEKDLLDLAPDIVSILIGVNDGPVEDSRYMPTSPDKYENLYRMMLDEIRQNLPDTKLVLMEPFVCEAGRLRPQYAVWRGCMEKYGEAVRRLAQDYNGIFVPLQEVFDQKCKENEPEYWSWDGVHPTENGHGLIALQWISAVKDLLGLSK